MKIRDLLELRGDRLALDVLSGESGLERELPSGEASSPGLVLAGYTGRFAPGRVFVLGETEVTYLFSLDAAARTQSIETLFKYDFPCLFVTKKQEVPAELLSIAVRRDVAVLRSALKTAEFYHRIIPFLQEAFSPHTTIHGSLADVYGVGLLFIGRSGIGKSECVLDLVERGHRLVADDLVEVRRLGHDVLIGRGHEHQHHFMEIRGIGLVDIAALFGIRAVRQQKRIEVVVRLEDWDSAAAYERTGLDSAETEVLDVTLPLVVVPLNPGKNITVIAEVVAMRHLLKYSGVDSARQFNEKLISRMQGRRAAREYLEEDYE
ncbi:MAG: HPr(Ser) kinase/phosphatase [Gemmatimonadota bacterium]